MLREYWYCLSFHRLCYSIPGSASLFFLDSESISRTFPAGRYGPLPIPPRCDTIDPRRGLEVALLYPDQPSASEPVPAAEPAPGQKRKPTIPELQAARASGRRLTMVTAYDFAFARLVDQSPIDMILVGDSAAMTVLGHESTPPVTMVEMLTLAKAVSRGAPHTFLVGDMPFMSYEATPAQAVRNAGRYLQEAAMDAVKLEGGRRIARTVAALAAAGIPVMGHVGLTPQSAAQLGGYRVQGRDQAAAETLVDDALALQEAGVFALVVEAVPAPVAAMLTGALRVPTIGIGAGPDCTGQVLVLHDLLGLFEGFRPRFVKQYADLASQTRAALAAYAAEVAAGDFPGKAHSYGMPADEVAALRRRLGPPEEK